MKQGDGFHEVVPRERRTVTSTVGERDSVRGAGAICWRAEFGARHLPLNCRATQLIWTSSQTPATRSAA